MSAETDALKAKLNAFAQEIQPTLLALNVKACGVVIQPSRINVSVETGKIVTVTVPSPAPTPPT